jgi:multiple sugar transport system ATP-binding protein
MNLARARIAGDSISVGHLQIPLNGKRPPASAGDEVILGIRPEAFEDAAFADSSLPQVDVKVRVLEELGADAHVFFEIDAETVVVEDAVSDDDGEDGQLLAERSTPLFTARVDPRTSARVGGTATLAIDPSRLYFFSPATGESLL